MSASIGGQAVIEGVMMRARRSLAVAVRKPDGDVVVRKDALRLATDRFPLLRRPFIRGVPALYYSLLLGIRALNYSAAQALEEEETESGPWYLLLSTLAALAAGVGIFFYLPLLLTEGLRHLVPSLGEGVMFNAVDGLFRLLIFLVYIFLISRWGEIRRVFEYHGAEHMAVAAYEDGRELNIDAVREYSTRHPRCGTSFLLVVMVVSVFAFSLIPSAWPLLLKFLARLLLLPAIAGVGYEIIKAGSTRCGSWMRILNTPGMWLQKMTTRPPDDSQIEVAVAALQAVLEVEGGRPHA